MNLLSFVFAGLAGITMKALAGLKINGGMLDYLLSFYFVISICGLVNLGVQKDWPTVKERNLGILLGISHLGITTGYLIAAFRLPGIIVFPVGAGGILVGTTLISWIFWKEQLDNKGLISVILGIIAVILLCYSMKN